MRSFRPASTAPLARGAIAAAALALVVSGCTSSSSESDATPSSGETLGGENRQASETCTEEKTGGGSVTYGTYTDGPGLDPAAPQANQGATQQAAIYGTLMKFDYESGEYSPDIAESLTASDDNAEWTLKLRDDVTFGDGTAMTADVVKASIERFTDPANPSNFSSQVALVDNMNVVDDQTLVFELSTSWGSFPYILATEPGMIVNTEILDEMGQEKFTLNPPAGAGAGAFEVVSYTANESLKVRAKKDWWGGPVCIDELTFVTTVDGQTKLDSFRSGQNQGFVTFDAAVSKQLQDDDDRFVVLGAPVISNVQILTTEGAPLADPRLRQALQYAQNLELVNDRVYAGVGIATSALIDPSSPLAPDVEPLGYDVEKAKELVEEAKADGENAEFEYLVTSSPLQVDLSILQEAFWKDAGFTIKRSEMQNSDLINKVYIERNYDAAMWGAGVDPACVWCGMVGYRSDNPTNLGSYANDDMDAAIDELQKAAAPEEIKSAMNGVQEVWNEDVPTPLNGFLKWVVAMDDGLQGVGFSAGTTVTFDKAFVDG